MSAAARGTKQFGGDPIPPVERAISVDDVKALQIGSRVNLHGNDKDGVHRWLECTVAGLPQHKFLTYRDHGTIRRCAIKEYPNKYFTKVV